MNEDYIAIGRVVRAHGTGGWVRVEVYSGQPQRFEGIRVLYLLGEEGPEGIILNEVKQSHMGLLLKFKNVDTREEAKALVGSELFLPESAKTELPEGSYFIDDLIGLTVFTEEGQRLGVLADVLQMSANDIYVVRDGENERLIPAVGEFVREVDVPGGKMIVRLLEGM